MNNTRSVKRLSSIIDLLNHDSVWATGRPSIRIRYEYDGINGSQKFIVLNRQVPKEAEEGIISWLEKNIKMQMAERGIKINCFSFIYLFWL